MFRPRVLLHRSYIAAFFLALGVLVVFAAAGHASLASLGYAALRWLDGADVVRHDLSARIDPVRYKAGFVDDITFESEGGRTLHVLLGVDAQLESVAYVRESISREGAGQEGAGQEGASSQDDAVEPLKFSSLLRLGALPFVVYRVALPDSLADETFTLRFTWSMAPSTVRFLNPFVAKHFFYVGYASLWYPHMPDEDFFEAAIGVTVPKGYLALAEGALARTAPKGREVTYAYRTDGPVSGMGIGVGIFHELDPIYAGEAVVEGWRPSGLPSTVDSVARFSAEAVDFFKERLGALPVSRFHVAEFPFAPPTSYATLYGLVYGGDFTLMGFRDLTGLAWLAAHETAHKWIGGAVGIRTVGSGWLREGLAEYLGYLATQSLVSVDEARKLFDERVYEPFAARMASGRERSLASIELFDEDAQMLFEKGPLVFRMLHRRLGDAAFYDLLKAFFAEYRGRYASGDDFVRFARSWVGRPGAGDLPDPSALAAFFRSWIERKDRLDYVLTGRLSGSLLRLEARSEGDLVEPGPVDLALHFDDGTTRLLEIALDSPVEIRTDARLVRAELDPYRWLADSDPANNTWVP